MYSSKKYKNSDSTKVRTKDKVKEKGSPNFLKKNTLLARKRPNKLNKLNRTAGESCTYYF